MGGHFRIDTRMTVQRWLQVFSVVVPFVVLCVGPHGFTWPRMVLSALGSVVLLSFCTVWGREVHVLVRRMVWAVRGVFKPFRDVSGVRIRAGHLVVWRDVTRSYTGVVDRVEGMSVHGRFLGGAGFSLSPGDCPVVVSGVVELPVPEVGDVVAWSSGDFVPMVPLWQVMTVLSGEGRVTLRNVESYQVAILSASEARWWTVTR